MVSSADHVRALVSGFPGAKRRLRGLMVLQAHIDVSTEAGKVLVMAGYIATAETWAEFSDEWEAVLATIPQFLHPFKMKRMRHPAERLAKAECLYRLVEKHAMAALSCSVNIADLHKVWGGIKWPPSAKDPEDLKNPYWFGFRGLVHMMVHAQPQLEINEPVDLVFDNDNEKKLIMAGWDTLKATTPQDQRKYLGDTPIYRDDQKVMPLQAADLYAWWVRRWIIEGAPEWWRYFPFPWGATRKEFPRMHHPITEPYIAQLLYEHLARAEHAFANHPRWASEREARGRS